MRLASPHTPPGGEAFVTIMLVNVPSQPLQVLKSEIEFPADQLTYVAATMRLAADLARATLDVSLQSAEGKASGTGDAPARQPPAGKARLSVVVTGSKPIPNGPVVELRFRVAPGLKLPAGVKEITVKLLQRSEGFAPDGAKIAKLLAEPGELRITTAKKSPVPTVFGCFFYMH